ncbi:diaminopimelate epimerase [Carboxylicivirga sp. N1Y90]|uniref:diaminopimelate epimerase n=1 Tax=Carboxylicivirga fragile TaxID=3417571 RepID=UPI003D341854|nr:diaminopimelate epimerase [Marinilabiliaceae bacterium N1Y90]
MIHFYKYQGTGNDFVIIDNRDKSFNGANTELVRFLCDRRFGVGGDGLMLLEEHDKYDFTMRYFNSDGNEASMCGNGGRCIAAFAVHQGIIKNTEHFSFMAIDGLHEASYSNNIVSIKMIDVNSIDKQKEYTFLNTGSPHYVEFTDDIDNLNVKEKGIKVRHSDTFKPDGTNANFVSFIKNDTLKVRTFERGVEDETLACGTGVVASAIAAYEKNKSVSDYKIKVLGGELRVSFETDDNNSYKNIWLEGPATFVFEGKIKV